MADEFIQSTCGAKTADGTPCQRRVKPGSGPCFYHAQGFKQKIKAWARNSILTFALTMIVGVASLGGWVYDEFIKKPSALSPSTSQEFIKPLDISASVNRSDYMQPIAGINWNPKYSELRIMFSNSAAQDLSGLDFWIFPDLMIADHGQMQTAVHCDFSPGYTREVPPITPGAEQELNKRRATGQPYALALPTFTSAERVRCGSLPRQTLFEIVLALINEKATPGKVGYFALGGLAPKVLATKVHIEGVYQAGSEERKITKDIVLTP